MQQAFGTDALVNILHACIRDAEQAVIDDAGYLRLLGFPDRQCQAGELWRHLIEATSLDESETWREPLRVILKQGPLARRILRAVGQDASRARLKAIYGELCDCLQTGRMFTS
jgi:carboxylate-amine ligase